MDAPALFNEAIFDDLQARIGSAKVGALFEIFRRTTEEGFRTLAQADEAAQDACLHQVTHMLVSTAGTLGFDLLSAESRAIMEGQKTGVFATLVADLRVLTDRSLIAHKAVAADMERARPSSLSAA